MHGDLLERALAADAARGGRVEAPRAGVAQQRPGDLDDVAGEVRRSARRARGASISPSPMQEAERELLVVAGRAHRDRERLAVDADLERLLDGDLVALAAVALDGSRSCGAGAGVVHRGAQAAGPASAGVRDGSSATGRTSTAIDLVLGAARC